LRIDYQVGRGVEAAVRGVDRSVHDGTTPLFMACERGHAAVAKLLLEA
jgi:ankyrin repeat protein